MKLDTTLRAVLEFNKVAPNAPLRLLLAFLFIAEAGSRGATAKQISLLMDCPGSAVSRMTTSLGDVMWNKGTPGYGLVEVAYDANNWRIKPLVLTQKGKDLLARMYDAANTITVA